ncbi:hypothetical protein Gotur_025935 [Gossypium turneri]
MASSDKKTKVKQKIEIKIIENANDRLIAFLNDTQEFIRKSLSLPLYLVGRFFYYFLTGLKTLFVWSSFC